MPALEPVITYAGGTRETIAADESFQVKEHPVVMRNVYGSGTWAGRLEQPGRCAPGFDLGRQKSVCVCKLEKEEIL